MKRERNKAMLMETTLDSGTASSVSLTDKDAPWEQFEDSEPEAPSLAETFEPEDGK